MSLTAAAALCNSAKQQFFWKENTVLKERSERISVKRIRLWAVKMYVFALSSVSATVPNCRGSSLY